MSIRTSEVIPVLDLPRQKLRRIVFIAATLVITAGMFADIQGVALSPLVATLSADLGLTGTQVGWAINGLTLVGAMSAGLLSRLADLVGHKKVLLPLIASGIIGAVLCALATNFTMLLIGRILLGLAVPIVAIVWGLIRPYATEKQIRSISVTLGTVIALGVVVALILGGALLSIGAGWHSVFWILAFGYGLMLLLTLLSPESPESVRDRIPLDCVGGIGLGVWLVALLLGITWGQELGWTSGAALGMFALFGVVLAAWIFQQVKNPNRLMAFNKTDVRQMLAGYTGGVARKSWTVDQAACAG